MISVEFNDGTGWDTAPEQTLNYAPVAIDAQQIAGFTANSLVRVADGAALGNISPLSNAEYT
ncbi:MAG: hypothetical protein EOP06_32580, partial [Proteobacteria bacterium]